MDESTPERWLPVVGWEGLYEVSSAGRVRSLPRKVANRMHKGRILREKRSASNRYLAVTLCLDGVAVSRRIHSLVAEAFIGPRPQGQEVRHGPNGRFDNSVSNLSYGTPAENAADTIRDGTRLRGSRKGNAKLTEADVSEIRRRYSSGDSSCVDLGKQYGVHEASIRFVVKGKTWKHVA